MTASYSPYRFGASFFDPASGLRFEGHHPMGRPDLWRQYLDGAMHEYERYGVGELIDQRLIDHAEDVPLFFVGIDGRDRVVAGVRCHGPLSNVDESAALAEMASSPEIGRLRSDVARVLPHGVVELKGLWLRLTRNRQAADTFSRVAAHAVEWLGAELALLALSDRLERALQAVGAVRMGRESVPYPSPRYRTILMGLPRSRFRSTMRPDFAAKYRQEAEQLGHRRRADDDSWKPIVLDPRRRSDRLVVESLRRDVSVTIIDAVEAQTAELVEIGVHSDRVHSSEDTRWVYFPWRGTAVRLLGPVLYPLVRLDRNRNRITREEQKRLRAQRIGIVGLSTGHSVATTLAMEGLCGELRLADFDPVALSNLNRLPGTVADVGSNKAVVAARRVAEIDPYLSVRIMPTGVTPENVEEFISGLDIVVEECDDLTMKCLVREAARRHRLPVIMETSDRGLLDVERFDLEPERPVFHGLVQGITSARIAQMPAPHRLAAVARVVDLDNASARLCASLVELGRSVSTWPQLGSEVVLGAASVAAAVRRIGLGLPVPSGRARFDLEPIVEALTDPGVRPTPEGIPSAAQSSASPSPASADSLQTILQAASLAPSGGNAQPWRFRTMSNSVSFDIERARTAIMDVRSRASYVALGGAVFNARVAAAALGRRGSVTLFPDTEPPDCVALMSLEDGSDEALAALHPWVLARCTNRRRGAPQPLDLSLAAELRQAVADEGASLRLITDRARLEECAIVLGDAERLRLLTPALHREMIGELRWPGDDVTTGIDVRSLELDAAELAFLGLLRRPDVMSCLRRWKAGSALADPARASVSSASALAVVVLPDASPRSYVQGGAAVERLWLSAQRAGVGVQPVPPFFVFAVQDSDFERLVPDDCITEARRLSTAFRAAVEIAPNAAMALVLRLVHAPPPTIRSARLPLDGMIA